MRAADPADRSPEADARPVPAGADFGLITPERLGDVVAPAKLKITKTVMSFDVTRRPRPAGTG